MQPDKIRVTMLLAGAALLVLCLPCRAAEVSLAGDADCDDDVDFADYQTLERNFGTGTTWQQGDFDADGDVDFTDYQMLERNFGKRLLAATVTIQNNTGATKTNWPVFLTVWKVFGGNLALSSLNPQGFHVFDSGGVELPYMLRAIPPDFSLGNDEIVFVVPTIASGPARTTASPTAQPPVWSRPST
jgi:hypothetical protein